MAVIQVPGQFPTIAAAMAAAQPGDTIQLGGGYTGETATITVNNLIIAGDAINTGISLNLGNGTGSANITLTGNAPITVFGNELDNVIIGNAGDNILSGGTMGSSGNDILVGGNGFDTFRGGRGNDIFVGGNVGITPETGPKELFQGGRADYSTADVTGSIAVVFAASATVTGNATVGTDTLFDVQAVRGTNNADTFTMTPAFKSLFGSYGEFEGRGGNDTIVGSAGAFIASSTRISYQTAASGVTVNMLAGIAQSTAAGDAAQVGVDTFSGVNQVRGSNFADILNGAGLEGILTFIGGGGNDQITGNGLNVNGRDFNYARYDNTTNGIAVSLGMVSTVSDIGGTSVGDDTLIQIQSVRGTGFIDTFIAAAGYNTSFGRLNEFEGMGGNDTITGNNFTRIAYTQATFGVTVDLFFGAAQSLAQGGDVNVGSDNFTGVNQVVGSTYDDQIFGTNGAQAERFTGLAGNDYIDGRGGSLDSADYRTSTAGIVASLTTGVVSDGFGTTDTLVDIEGIRGSEFNDTIIGNAGNNILSGQNGNDTILGNDGNDFIIGDDNPSALDPYDGAFGSSAQSDLGDDYLDGGAGADTIYGGSGNDLVFGNAGVDQLFGDNGNDLMIGGFGGDNIDGGAGFDTAYYGNSGAGVVINLLAGTASGGEASGDTLISIENVYGSAFTDQLLGDSTGNELVGLAGDDFMEGRGGADALIGGEGNDTASYLNSASAVTINLTNLSGAGGDAAGDLIVGIENVYGSAFNDILRGDAVGNLLLGASGDDTFFGEGGNDTILGGAGNDVATGGAGNDVFFVRNNEGADTIVDFDQNGDDVIVFADFGQGFGVGNLQFTANSNGTLVTAVGWNGSLLLQNAAFGIIGTDDFLFV